MFRMLEQQPEARDFDPAPLFPDAGPEELARHVSAVRDWLKGLPLGRRPLVQVSDSNPNPCPYPNHDPNPKTNPNWNDMNIRVATKLSVHKLSHPCADYMSAVGCRM